MKWNNLCSFVLGIALLLCTAGGALGQGTTSRVTGTVLDEKGSAIPGATVTLTNEGTQVSLNTETSDSGAYLFDSIQIGTYSVTVEKQGFKKFTSTGNKININQPATINAAMEVGGVSEVVEVIGSAEIVQTSSSGNFGNTVEERPLETLPLVGTRGRNPLQFIEFQPGVVSGANTGGGVHVHGARDRAFNFTLDGIDANDPSAGGSNFAPIRTNPDSLSEFQVITGNATAEFGRSSGASVTLVTRSGTNDFHGTGFWFYQTPRFNANEFSNTINRLPRGQFVQHIYGGSVGGPIIKNKTFFFTNLQLLKATQSISRTRTVLTDSARQGLFRYVIAGRNNPTGPGGSVDANGNPLPGLNIGTYNIGVRDPLGLGLDPSIQALLALAPSPNNFIVGDGLNFAGFTFASPQSEKQYDLVFKIDHNFNDRNAVYVRYAQGSQNTLGDPGNGNINRGFAGDSNGGPQAFPNSPRNVDTFRTPKNLAVNYRWTPAATVTNELVVGFNRFGFSFNNADPNAEKNPPFYFNCPVPGTSGCLDITNPLDSSPPVNNARKLRVYQLVDNLSWIRGSQTLKFGTNIRYQQHIDDRGSVAGLLITPFVDFSRITNPVDPTIFGLPPASGANSINANDLPRLQSLVNTLLGRVGNIAQGFVATSDDAFGAANTRFNFDARYPEYDFYAQDTWKIRSNLTIDFGVRWEIKLSPRGPNNVILRPDRPVRFGETPRNDIRFVEGKLFDDDWNNFAPTVGVAWDPFKTGKTSVRANYRLAYDRMNTFVLSSTIFQSAPGATLPVTNSTFGVGGGRVRNGIPTPAPPAGLTPLAFRQPASFSTSSLTVVDPSIRSPKTHQWGVSIQREIGWNSVLEVNYIGRRGVGLYGAYDVNQVDIFNNGFLQAFNTLRNSSTATSPLINQLLTGDPNNNAGSATFRTRFSTELTQASVAATAAALATTLVGGRPIAEVNLSQPFFFRPYPQFSGSINVLDSHDISTYNALEVQLKRRFFNGLSFQTSYTWAKSLDTRSFDPTFSVASRGSFQSASSTPFDLRDRKLNYARSDFDRRHAFQGYFVYDVPFGRGRRYLNDLNPALDRVIGGFELAGIVIWESGRPFTIYSGSNTVSNVVQSPANCTNCTPGMGFRQLEGGRNFYFSPEQRARFSIPAPGELGNTGRNFFTAPSLFRIDLTVGKKFKFTETTNLEIRMEVQNATNHPSFDIPTAVITASVFGRINDAVVSTSRKVQFSAKFNF
ncbi:MAG: carboxypeptidase regulatory-like domain-containing protein [Acidobacteria bacterium]|nr:carboxypeptidase regulatory-like domain-containing protein [Acidobacteriota bacterium]